MITFSPNDVVEILKDISIGFITSHGVENQIIRIHEVGNLEFTLHMKRSDEIHSDLIIEDNAKEVSNNNIK